MNFKSHPYYDDSGARDWMHLHSDAPAPLEPEAEKALQERLTKDKQWLCGLALDRIRAAAGESYLAERPYPDVNNFQFIPIGQQGYRGYIEYVFFQRPDENTPDSDFWWVIINCPNATDPLATRSGEAVVIGFGWAIP